MDDQTSAIESLPADAPRSRVTNAIFDRVEHWAYIAVGALLAVVALLSLGDSIAVLWHGLMDWQGVATVAAIIERLLFVLMLAEILHTVRASMRSGGLSAEPLLIVGMIACIRRVLVSTLESAEAGSPGGHGGAPVSSSMIELGVLGFLILIFVVSIYMLRQARAVVEKSGPLGRQG